MLRGSNRRFPPHCDRAILPFATGKRPTVRPLLVVGDCCEMQEHSSPESLSPLSPPPENAFPPAKHPQKRPPKPVWTHLWEITNDPSLLFGQLQGSTHPAKGQLQGICLEKSQPNEPTFPGRATPLRPTFDRVSTL
jgi:hypothetical protein